MGHLRLQLVVGLGGAVLALLALLLSCSGEGLRPAPLATTQPQRFSSQWFAALPHAQVFGGCDFYLLDRDYAAQDWLGLSFKELADGQGLQLQLTAQAQDDFYIYIVCPAGERQVEASLAQGRGADWLLLSISDRIPGVVVLGISRKREARLEPAGAVPLIDLMFKDAAAVPIRQVSAVNTDLGSAAELAITGTTPSGVVLSWQERNIGDYDNNGEVNIADLTPVGKNFGLNGVEAPDADAFELVDGDGNGEINISDLTAIGRNFLSTTGGFNVYHATIANPAPGDFSAVNKPAVLRADVYAATAELGRTHRLNYTFDAVASLGWNHYYVRAFGAGEPLGSEGPLSNRASFEKQPSNLPPAWESAAGISEAVAVPEGVRISFGRAIDPEGSAVTYVLHYVPSPGTIFGAGSIAVDLPESVSQGDPPYNHTQLGLVPGQVYTLLLRARDELEASTSNLNSIELRVPQLRESDDPWACLGGNAQRTWHSGVAEITLPVSESWRAGLGFAPGTEPSYNDPVVSSAGWLAVLAGDGLAGYELRKYETASGTLLDTVAISSELPLAPDPPWYEAGRIANLSMFGEQIALGTRDGVAVVDFAVGAVVEHELGAAVVSPPLLLGGYLVVADQNGVVRAMGTQSGEVFWSYEATEAVSTAPVLGGDSLFVCTDAGQAVELSALTGNQLQNAQLGEVAGAPGLALNSSTDMLYGALAVAGLTEISVTDFSRPREWGGGLASYGSPLLVEGAVSLLIASFTPAPSPLPENYLTVQGIDLLTGDPTWSLEFLQGHRDARLSATDKLVAVNSGNQLMLLDHTGRRLQDITLPGLATGAPVLAEEHLLLAGAELAVYGEAAVDNPPVWVGTGGIRALGYQGDSIVAEWDHAVDELGQAVYYFVLVNEGNPPDFADPAGNSQTIVVPHGDSTHSIELTGLLMDHRYYVAVRAADGPDYATAQVESNTELLLITPPWEREELVLGEELPAGEIQFMRGIVDPTGTLHLVYNDQASGGELNHVFNTGDGWQHEGANLNAFAAQAVYPSWDSDSSTFVIGYSYAPTVALLRRISADSWQQVVLTDAQAATNPQLAVLPGTESLVAYTEYIEGSWPLIEEHIYTTKTAGGIWQGPEELDAVNYAGRDLALLPGPLDGKPLLAYQRGTFQAFNRLTPRIGQLFVAEDDGAGGFTVTEVDAGENAPDSDCGKRVALAFAADGTPHLAYLDLNSDPDSPKGQLKHAWYDGLSWQTERLFEMDLDFQTDIQASLQFTYGEIGLAVMADGTPVITELSRLTASNIVGTPHTVELVVWARDAQPGDQFYPWRRIPVTDAEFTFQTDREPCQLLITPDGVWHAFFVTTQPDNLPLRPDTIVHLSRPVLP